jgi:hypothetical protein
VKNSIFCATVALALSASPTWAAFIYSAPPGTPAGTAWSLLPNKAGQQVNVYTTGGEPVAGFNFYATIGDGGADLGGIDVGPTITDVVLHGVGMTFPSGEQTDIETSSSGMYVGTSIALTGKNATVAATGLLATLTIDTTGFAEAGESWPLKMDLAGTTFTLAGGAELVPTFSNGILAIAATQAPEPGTLTLLVSIVALAPVLAWWRRRRSS